MGFKVGDKVVVIGSVFELSGRPKVRIIQKIYPSNEDGVVCYGGKYWKASSKNLVLESEYQWPSEFKMRVMDKRARESLQSSLEEITKSDCDPELKSKKK